MIAWRPGRGAVSKKLDGRYGYAAAPGPRGCSCLLPILPKAECNGLAAPNNQTSQLRKQVHKAKSKGRQNLGRKQGQKAARTGNHSPRGQNERKTWPKGKAKKAKMKEYKAQKAKVFQVRARQDEDQQALGHLPDHGLRQGLRLRDGLSPPPRLRKHHPQAAGCRARAHYDLVGHSAGQGCRLCGNQPGAARHRLPPGRHCDTPAHVSPEPLVTGSLAQAGSAGRKSHTHRG